MHAHEFAPDPAHEGWETCSICRSAHNSVEFPREKYLSGYWTPEMGHSTLVDQRYNLEVIENGKGESKVKSVLKHCTQGPILEVACAPGSFLKAAKLAGFEVRGLEPDRNYSQEILEYSGCDVITGFFEDIFWEGEHEGELIWGTIVAMDLTEHLCAPNQFVDRCMAMIKFGGRLILMIPTIESVREQDFHPEHVNIWSCGYLQEWLNPILIEPWLPGHDILIIEKPYPKGSVAGIPGL